MDTKNNSISDQPKDNTMSLGDQSMHLSKDLIHETQEKSVDLMNQVQTHLKTKLTDEKNVLSDSLEHVSTAVSQAGAGLRENDQEVLGNYADSASHLVKNLSNYLEKTDIEDFVKDLEIEVRKRPALFIGGFFVVGLLTGRFLKSSSHANAATVTAIRKNDDSFTNAATI